MEFTGGQGLSVAIRCHQLALIKIPCPTFKTVFESLFFLLSVFPAFLRARVDFSPGIVILSDQTVLSHSHRHRFLNQRFDRFARLCLKLG